MTDIPLSDTTELTDELVQAARSDRRAFGALFDHFYSSIFAYCMRRLLVRAVAEDVTSDVFLKVTDHIRDFSGLSVEDFRRWLFRIATNEINAQLRQSIRRRELLEAAARMGALNAVVTTPLEISDTVEWDEVYQSLGELQQRDQSLISLRFFAQLKYDQIAAVLEMKTGTVRVALSRALNKLRERLRENSELGHATPSPAGRGD
jgi:RNA polymerase sigma-70 factor (ECF subfamily)